MAVSDYSTSAESNTSISGINIAEGCSPGNINNAIRQLMADVKTLANGLDVGSDVQAYDAGLASIAGLTTAANKMIYTTALDTYAVTDLTAAGRALLDDADAAAQLVTLGIGGDIPAIEALASTGIAVRTAANTWAQRQIVSADGSVTITNPAGVAGDIDLSVTTGGVSADTAASSGTAVDIGGIPATATHVWIMFDAVSLNGTDDLLVQIGDSGGIENTGYVSGSRETAASSTAGFIVFLGNATRAAYGVMELVKGAGNKWFASHDIYSPTISSGGGGVKTLSDTLTQIRLTRTGSNSFDGSGTVTVRWA